MFTDIHCHLNDEKYQDKADVVAKAREAGVDRLICAGYDMASTYAAKELAERFDEVYFTAGIHPDAEREATKENLAALKKLCAHEKCVAVGEIGLDYHYQPFDKEGQMRAFAAQVELAGEVSLPFVVHSRDCTQDLLSFLRSHVPLLQRGFVMHCFSGSSETAQVLLKLGAYISFAGPLTFRNSKNLPQVAALVPKDRILTETDSPYLAPHPFRGETNQPANVSYVAEKLAEIRGVDAAQIAVAVRENARRIFYRMV